MASAAFWTMIAGLGASADPDQLDRLTDRLARQQPSAILRFADGLARAVHALDTPEHYRQDVRDVSEPPDGPALPMSDDVFLYARCAVVAAGRDRWMGVVRDPAAFAGQWPIADAEGLLSVAPTAYERATGLDWAHEPPVDLEARSNTAAWGLPDPEPRRRLFRWVRLYGGSGIGVRIRNVHLYTSARLVLALDADEEWRRWWATAGVPDLELWPHYSREDPPRQRLGRSRTAVTVNVTLDSARFDTVDHEDLQRWAIEDVTAMLAFAQERMKLPPLPPLPWFEPVPPVSDGFDDHEVRTLPSEAEMLSMLARQLGRSPRPAMSHLQDHRYRAVRTGFAGLPPRYR